MEPKIEVKQRPKQQDVNYTAFDRKLIKAQIEQLPVLLCLTKPTYNKKDDDWVSVLEVKMISIDKYFIEVFFTDADRAIWLSKSNIVSAMILDSLADDV